LSTEKPLIFWRWSNLNDKLFWPSQERVIEEMGEGYHPKK
jgi:hypothetical protein